MQRRMALLNVLCAHQENLLLNAEQIQQTSADTTVELEAFLALESNHVRCVKEERLKAKSGQSTASNALKVLQRLKGVLRGSTTLLGRVIMLGA